MSEEPIGNAATAPASGPGPRTDEARAENREVWMKALEGLLGFADELKSKTEAELAAGVPVELRRVSFLICARGRRLLQSIRVLAQHEWDDIVGNLARALVEATVDLEYLHTSTTLVTDKKKGTTASQTPDVKASLFATQVVMFEKKMAKALRPDHEDWFKAAVELREQSGVQQGPFWHGRRITGDGSIMEELLAAASADPIRMKRLQEIYWWFGMTSFMEHNSPNMNFYIAKEGPGHRLLEGKTHPGLIEAAIRAGAEICWMWGWLLGMDEDERNAGLKPVEIAAVASGEEKPTAVGTSGGE